MFSTTLVRLIDESVLPALILVLTKLAGVLFIARFFNLSFEIAARGKFLPLPSFTFMSGEDYIKVNAYSNFLMFVVVALGFIFVLIRAHHFHGSHIHPNTLARVERWGLGRLIGESVDIYHQALIWLLFTWFVVILQILNLTSGLSYLALTVIAFLVALNLTWLLVFDVEKEIVLAGQTSEG